MYFTLISSSKRNYKQIAKTRLINIFKKRKIYTPIHTQFKYICIFKGK